MNKIEILEQYRDKSYVSNVLCQSSSDFYNTLKSIISIPLILSSSVMTILNSSDINTDQMKIANIVLNGCTVVLLSLSSNFKVAEKQTSFRTLALKFNKLCHLIEDKLMYDIDKITHQEIKEIIKDYDTLHEALEFTFPHHIKTRTRNTYKNKRTLPNILNCENSFVIDVKTDIQDGLK